MDKDNDRKRDGLAREAVLKIYQDILVEIRKLQPSADMQINVANSLATVTIEGEDRHVWINVKAQRDARRSSMSYTYYNGKYDITLESSPGGQATFKSRKDGVPCAEIAKSVFDVARVAVKREKDEEAREIKRQGLNEECLRLREKYEFAYSKHWDVCTVHSSNLAFSFNGTPERIEQVLSILKEQGLL